MSKQVKSLWRIESSYNIVSTRKSRHGIAQAGNIQYRQPSTEVGKRAKCEGEADTFAAATTRQKNRMKDTDGPPTQMLCIPKLRVIPAAPTVPGQ